MKKLLVILTLILTGIWAYTSWYWYTCSIKGFCDTQKNQTQVSHNMISGNDVFIDDGISELEDTASGKVNNVSDAPKLSADDVLSETKIKKVEKSTLEDTKDKQTKDEKNKDETENEDTVEDEIEVNITVLSGALDESKEDEVNEEISKDENLVKQENQNPQHILCTNPIIGPIGIGLANNSEEVKNLENFLASQGETVTKDGIYGKDEFEAMKRFQLKYRADILDPWDIAEPTGYVYKTTIKKIHELACK